jgi:MGT family glycosyltransferase
MQQRHGCLPFNATSGAKEQIYEAGMKRSHIAFVSFPHHPHVNPTLPIASVLLRRGHRVSYVTSDKFKSRVARLGVELLSCPEFTTSPGFIAQKSADTVFRLAERTLETMMPLYERDRPDLIVYDIAAFAGRILANKLNVPAIQTSSSFAHNRENWEQQVRDPEFRRELVESSNRVDQFFHRHGIASNGILFHREKLNIYLFSELLQPQGEVLSDSCFYAGRCAAEQPYYGEWQKRESGGPTVMISTSTTHVQGTEFFKTCVGALSGLNCHVIVSIGDSGNAVALEPLPHNVEIVQHTSHVKVLPYVDVFICLAGIITASEAMYHGVPLVVTSLGILENEWEGDIFERLGIAIHLRKAAMNAETLRSAVIRALEDPGIRNRVREVRGIIQREPGGEETANRIEAYLEARSARLEPS